MSGLTNHSDCLRYVLAPSERLGTMREMSSKYSVINFSKDQATLQAAANALTGYLIISMVWMTGSAMISFGQYSYGGLITSMIANLVLVGWIYFSYIYAFNIAAKKYGLEPPKLFRLSFDI